MSVYFDTKKKVDRLCGMLAAAKHEGDITTEEHEELYSQIHERFVKLVIGRPEGDEWMTKATLWLADEFMKMQKGKSVVVRALLLESKKKKGDKYV